MTTKLITAGHSEGAGIATVLAVLYHSKYDSLHFSLPGSLYYYSILNLSLLLLSMGMTLSLRQFH